MTDQPANTPQRVDVERFYPWIEHAYNGGVSAEMVPAPDGGYVTFNAYAALLQQVAELEEYRRLSDEANGTLKTMCAVADAKLAEQAAEIEIWRKAVHSPDGWVMQLARAERAREESERDAARLDFLLEHCAVVKTDGQMWRVEYEWLPEGTEGPWTDTKRDAIDAAYLAANDSRGQMGERGNNQ